MGTNAMKTTIEEIKPTRSEAVAHQQECSELDWVPTDITSDLPHLVRPLKL